MFADYYWKYLVLQYDYCFDTREKRVVISKE